MPETPPAHLISRSGRDGAGVAVVTGAGTGIGRAIALALARRGRRLVLAGRRLERLQSTREEVAKLAHEPIVRACDVAVPEAVDALRPDLEDADVLVNAAGIARAGLVHELPVSAFDEVLAANLRGTFLLCRAILPFMRERGRGTIVNVSSVAARRSFSGMGAYAAAKAGLLALSGVIREENRAFGIRVVDVVPGATDTPIWESVWPGAPRERMMTPDEVAEIVVDAITREGTAMVEEIVIRPQGGDL